MKLKVLGCFSIIFICPYEKVTKVVIPTRNRETEVNCKASWWPSQVSKKWNIKVIITCAWLYHVKTATKLQYLSICFSHPVQHVQMIWPNYALCNINWVEYEIAGLLKVERFWNIETRCTLLTPLWDMDYMERRNWVFFTICWHRHSSNLPWSIVCFNKAKSMKILNASSEGKC